MMESNSNLIENQYKQLLMKNKIDGFNKDRNEFKRLVVDFLTEAENLSTFIGFTAMESIKIDLSKHVQKGTYGYEIYKELRPTSSVGPFSHLCLSSH